MGPNTSVTPLGWSKDTILLPEIKLSLEKSQNPSLVFAISVQGHGGYPDDKTDTTEIKITSDYNRSNKANLEYYLQQIHEMDIFIGDLINLINECNEPTVLVLYGDHIPAVGLSNDDLTSGNQKQTSYVMWDNLGLEKNDEDLKSYEISTKILSALNFPDTTLSKLYKSSMPNDQKLEALKVLEYDILYGKSYVGDYKKPVLSDSFKYGLRNLSIDSVSLNDDYVEIKGENFNGFSKVYINDDLIDTEFIDENTLKAKTTDINKEDKLIVKQLNYSKSNIYATSNDYIFK